MKNELNKISMEEGWENDFQQIFWEINRLNGEDPASHGERLGKLTEEVGELAKAINKTNGRKVLKAEDTPESIQAEILDEAADVIQNVLSIVDGFDFTATEVLMAIVKKNKKWEQKMIEKKIKNNE